MLLLFIVFYVYHSGVMLRFYGFAHVHWTERHSTGSGKNRRTVTRHYSNNETYFDSRVYLWGDGKWDSDTQISPKYEIYYTKLY